MTKSSNRFEKQQQHSHDGSSCDSDMCSVTSTDMTDSSITDGVSSSLDDHDDHDALYNNVSPHRICIFEFAIGEEEMTTNCDNDGSQHQHLPTSTLQLLDMWRKSYITESCSTLSDLSYQSEEGEDGDGEYQEVYRQADTKQEQKQQSASRFLPKILQRSLKRINALRPLAAGQ
jgi:hypothetical protein